jgi:N-acetylglucosamine-6-phosphate deacetylase
LDGARGAHDRRFAVSPSFEVFDELEELCGGWLALVTLAPELDGSMKLIRRISEQGVVVSLGHHMADGETIRKASLEGAKSITHLGNGLPNLLPRHPNPIWDQLDDDQLVPMLITDGHHIPDSFIRVVAHLKGACKFIVVSDSAPVGGYPPGTYQALGQEVVLEESGKLWNPVGNHLVGSNACMTECMNHLASLELLTEDELWQVGLDNPLKLLSRENEWDDIKGPRVHFEGKRFRVK